MPYRVAPAPPPKIPDGPDYIGAAKRAARRNRRIGIAVTLAIAAGGLAAIMAGRERDARHRAAFETAKLDLEACLLGPEPLVGSAGGWASCNVRVRRRQLVAMATPVERRIDDALNGWPMRCSEPTRRMMREGIELGDVALQRQADEGTHRLATMKALSAPIDLPLCTDASGRDRRPHLSTGSADGLPPLAAPLDLDALLAHGAPPHPAKHEKELDAHDARLTQLLPDGYLESGATGTTSDGDTPRLPEGESAMTNRDWPGVIHVAKCHDGKCQKRIVSRETFDLNDPELRASTPERFQAARVGGSILAVWRGGTRGGLRMRVAPLDRLATTRDIVVFDDLVRERVLHGTSTLEAFRIYGGAREARVFLITSTGTWIVTVDEKGAFALL